MTAAGDIDMHRTPGMAELRAGADPEVWSNVSQAMREVEVRDSIVFRVGEVGRGWHIAARLAAVAVMVWAVATHHSHRGASWAPGDVRSV